MFIEYLLFLSQALSIALFALGSIGWLSSGLNNVCYDDDDCVMTGVLAGPNDWV